MTEIEDRRAQPMLELYEKRLDANRLLIRQIRATLSDEQVKRLRSLPAWERQIRNREEHPWRPA